MNKMPNQRGVSAVVVILVLLLLLILAGGGFFFYKQRLDATKNAPASASFKNIDLNEEVVLFLFKVVPRLYNRVAKLDTELSLIAEELDRIKALEAEYPAEKRTVASERLVWMQLRKELLLSAQYAKTAAEAYYVAYSVNSEKGKKLISEGIGDLLSGIDETLDASNQETRRLKTTTQQTALDRLKGLFSK
jgi:hypothetical protein